MLARILAPGPSLAGYAPGDFSGLIIGVNRAAIMQPADIWACSDTDAIRDFGPAVIGCPALLTTGFGREGAGRAWRGSVAVFESLYDFLPPFRLPWTTLTFTAAIVYAAWRGAERIDCYGADWRGTQDADGMEAGRDRTAGRWKRESEIFRNLAEALKHRGIEVMRIVDGI